MNDTPTYEQLKMDLGDAMKAPETVPGPDNFNLDAFIEERSTFPVIKHVVYLDQDAGYQLLKLSEEITQLEEQVADLRRGVEHERENLVLTMAEPAPSQAALDAAMARLGSRSKEYVELERAVLDSALLVELQLKDPDQVRQGAETAAKEFYEAKGIPEGTNEEELPQQLQDDLNREVNAVHLAGLCLRITRIKDGVCQPAPISTATIHRLNDRLALSERVRLAKAVNEVLNMSTKWADRIDAGFRSGSTDVGG